MVATRASYAKSIQRNDRVAGRDGNSDGVGLYRRVCVLSEDLAGLPDEGVRKFALAIAGGLQKQHSVSVVTTGAQSGSDALLVAPAPRTFLSKQLRTTLAEIDPEILIYVARSSATFMSLIRSRVLKSYCPRSSIVLIGLQSRHHSRVIQPFVRYFSPDHILVQSLASKRYLETLGCSAGLIHSGVDLDTFQPAAPEARTRLRERYGFHVDRPVVLHVGHLKAARGIRVLADLAARDACQVVLIASSSTSQETRLGQELRDAGVTVLTEYLPCIQEIYQAADCYVFPVESTDNAIEVPLSVLEAFGCDLPVVTTRFGGLNRLFGEHSHPGIAFIDSPAELADEAVRLSSAHCSHLKTAHAHAANPLSTRSLALPHSWEAVVDGLMLQVSMMRGDQ